MELPEKRIENIQSIQTSKNTAKHEVRVRSAGEWARVLGWLILVVIPLYGLINLFAKQSASETLGTYALAVPAAFYLLISGKYISKLGGKGLMPLLIINAIVSVFFVGGLIPIFTVIFSIVGAVNFSKLKKSRGVEYKKQKATLSAAEIVVSIIIAFAGFTVLIYATNQYNNGDGTSTSTTSSSDIMTPFTSVEHGFQISFPGTAPDIQNSTLNDSGVSIPYTTYSKSTSDGSTAYEVAVYDYTGYTLDQKAGLEGAVNGAVQNTKNATRVTSSYGTFQGQESIDAEYTFPSDGNTYTAYLRAFYSGNKMYGLFAIGSTQAQANNFYNSFGFTQ